jgi:ankyrin repeat protein
VVELLLKHGADVNVKDVDDKIPLQRAIEAGYGTIVEILKSADEECVN